MATPLRHALRRKSSARSPVRKNTILESLEGRMLLAVDSGLGISGFVFQDADANGTYSANEATEAVTLELFADNGDGIFSSDDTLTATEVTNAAGEYCFDAIDPTQRYFVVRPLQSVDGVELPEFVSQLIDLGIPNQVIDQFETRQVVSAEPPAPTETFSSVLVNADEAVGGERDMFVRLDDGTTELDLKVNPFGLDDVLVFGSAAGAIGTRVVTWDGVDNDGNALAFGLGGIDLTDSGRNTGVLLRAGRDSQDSTLTLSLFGSSANVVSTATIDLPDTGGTPDGIVYFPFSDFVGNADVTNIGAIRMAIDSTDLSGDGTIDFVGVTSPLALNIVDQPATTPADLAITKTDNQAFAVPGETTSYTIVVTNQGGETASRVSITDNPPAELQNVSYISSATGDVSGNGSGADEIDELVDIGPGASVTYTLNGTIASSATGILFNEAEVFSRFDADPSNNLAGDVTSLTPEIDLQIAINDFTNQVVVGQQHSYEITVTNFGPSDALGATVTNVLPFDFFNPSFTSAVTGGASGNTLGGSGLLNETVDLPAGSSIVYTVTGTVGANASAPYTASATVVGPSQGVAETDLSNNSSVDVDQVGVIDLAVTKTASRAIVAPGDDLTYVIQVANIGSVPVDAANLTDDLPDALENVTFTTSTSGNASVSRASGTGNLNETLSLPPGATVTYTINATVSATASTSITNTAAIVADGDDSLFNNIGISVIDVARPNVDLSITKTDGNSIVVPGSQVIYTIVVTNHGPADANGVLVQDAVAQGMGNVTYESSPDGGATGNTASGDGDILDRLNMPAGSSVTYRVSGSVALDIGSVLSNSARVSAPEGMIDSNPTNNVAVDTNVTDSVRILGSDPTVIVHDEVVSEINDAIFMWTAHHTGKAIFNLHSLDELGNLDIVVLDSRGNVVANATSLTNQKQIVLPVVSQEKYLVRVDGTGNQTNSFDLEIENFAAPIPSIVGLDPNDDTGMLNSDAVTNNQQPRFLINADLSDFQNMGISILSPENPSSSVSSVPTEPGAAVLVRLTTSAGNEITGFASPVNDEANLFEFTPSNALPEGEYFVRASIMMADARMDSDGSDPAFGNTTLSEAFRVTNDVTPPTAARRPDLLRAADSGMSDTDDVTNKLQPAFRGDAEPGAKVRIVGNREGLGTGEILGQSIVNSDGRWEITSEPLVDGVHHIRAEFEDLAGNLSGLGEPLVMEVDTTAPNTPHLDLQRSSDNGMSETDNITNDNTLTFRMTTTDPRQNQHLFPENFKYRLYLRPDAATGLPESLIYYSFTDPTLASQLLDGYVDVDLLTRTLGRLPDGVHNFKLEVEDRAGNISHDFLLDVTIDTVDPAATIDLVASSDSGMMSDDDVTKQNRPTFTGISEVGSKVDILANGQIVGQGIVQTDASDGDPNNGLGIWQVSVDQLADSRYEMTSVVTDIAGNSTTSEPIEIWVDTQKPNTGFIDLISDTGISNTDNITSDTTPDITITAGATIDGGPNEFPNEIKVRIYDRPGDGTGEILIFDSFASLQDFTNSGFLTETLPELSEGVHNLKMEIEDRAGNISDPFFIDIEIDSTLPTIDIALLEASDSGMLSDDSVTNISSPTFVGTGTIGDQVYLFANGTLVGESKVGGDLTDGVAGNGLGAWQITIDHLTDGTYDVVAQIEDASGHVVASNNTSITIDTQEPNTPFLDLLTDTGFDTNDNRTNVNTPTVAIVANDTTSGGENPQPNDIKYRIYDRTNTGVETLLVDSFATLEDFTTGGFFEEVLPELTDGVHNLKLEVEDRAGNISHDFLLELFVDTTDPVEVTIDLLTASDTGMSNTDNVTRLDQPAFTGIGTVGDRVNLFANGELVGTTIVGSDASDGTPDDGLGLWEITSEPLNDNAYEITAHLEDEAGNSVESGSLTIEVDTIAPNTPFLDLIESDDTGRHNDDNITSADNLTFTATTHDSNPEIHRQLIPDGQNLKYRLYARPESGEEALVYQSFTDGTIADLLDGFTAETLIETSEIALPEGLHNLKLEVEDRAGNISQDFLQPILIDRTAPSCQGSVHTGFDAVTRSLRVTGEAEANAIVTLAIDGVPVGTTVAIPLDGDDAFSPPSSPSDVARTWSIDALVQLDDGTHTATIVCEDAAGNRATETIDASLVIDTQRPSIENLTRADGTSLFALKPEAGPDPLIHSIVLHFTDQQTGSTTAAINETIASEEGHYILVGDANGHIPIVDVVVNNPNGTNLVPRSQVELFFDNPLPDDRFTIYISDSIVDQAGNSLDGESGALAPFVGNSNDQTPPIFPTGDNVPGGEFAARFTVDSRPEIGTWGAGTVWVDTNGNWHFDPENVDYVNRDIVYKMSFTSDDMFAGNFALEATDTTDGYDKIAAYGRAEGQFRWIVDTDNDGVPNIDRVDPHQANALPVAGRFDGNDANGDEVGLFDGSTWYIDTDHDFQTDLVLPSFLVGYPMVGDFDGDGFDDLGTYADDTFMLDFANGQAAGWDGLIDQKIEFGIIGVRERPIAADMDQDGFDDFGLWFPDREGVTERDRSEWFFLISNGRSLLDRLSPQDDPVNTNQTIDFTPIPFGPDRFARFGDEFAKPIVGNFDPPTLPGLDVEAQFSNAKNPLDVNDDGQITPIDVLLVVNEINTNGARQLTGSLQTTHYYDTSQDGFLSAQDALLVVIHVNENVVQRTEAKNQPVFATAKPQIASAVLADQRKLIESPSALLDSIFERKAATDALFAESQEFDFVEQLSQLFWKV